MTVTWPKSNLFHLECFVSDLQPCSVWDLSGWIADLSSSSFFYLFGFVRPYTDTSKDAVV